MSDALNEAEAKAEKLRLQGNDAFGTKDWTRALQLYQSSVKASETPKAYSNLAATLCKLARYHEASQAAERATKLDPLWAKGWWRRAVVAEMTKFFSDAHRFYTIATELEPNETAYQKGRKSVEKRLNMKHGIVEPRTIRTQEQMEKSASMVAWARCCQDNPFQMFDVYVPRQTNFPNGNSPTSEQWLCQGLCEWSMGLRNAVAGLAVAMVPELRQQYQNLLRQPLPESQMLDGLYQLLGGDPRSIAMQQLTQGFAHLGGSHVSLKTGSSNNDDETSFCAQPAALSFLPTYQSVAIVFSIHSAYVEMLGQFGIEAKMSQAVLEASDAFCINVRSPKQPKAQAASPKQVVQYIKQQLQRGQTWDGGVRKFVSLQYRGTVLYAGFMRLFGLELAKCYEYEKWAREFITNADKEFKVSKEKTYGEKGSAFIPSFRIGMMLSELSSLHMLRGDRLDGPYPIDVELGFAVELANMAKNIQVMRNYGQPEYCFVQNDVACRLKPLAMAHATIGSLLTTLEVFLSRESWDAMTLHHGFCKDEDDKKSPFAIIAEHYRIAAESELPDSKEGALYWWAYASNMARAGAIPGHMEPYTLGELRRTIAKAEEVEKGRDVGLFGINPLRGASHESTAVLTANYYGDKPDSFRLPQVKIVVKGKVRSLEVHDAVICPNVKEYENRDDAYLKSQQKELELLDTADLEKVHGADHDTEIPSLERLCIRELHKQECEFAVGETDGAVIHYKFMHEARQKDLAAKE